MKPPTSSLLRFLFLLAAPLVSQAASDSSAPKDALSPCVVRSPTTGLFYDLNTISLSPPLVDGDKPRKGARDESWHARGHDYNANFTLNICAPVVEDIKDVVGVDRARWRNVSAYYEREGKVYSIGYGDTILLYHLPYSLTDAVQSTSIRPLLPRPKAGHELYQWLPLCRRLHRKCRPHQIHHHVVPL